MGNRLSKIYTRTGDDGTTGLGNGERVKKDSLRVEAYGSVDELNSLIGLILSEEDLDRRIIECLTVIQHQLFDLGGELCIPGTSTIDSNAVSNIESALDDFNGGLPPLKDFVLPGGTRAAATCHVARSICRRAERRVLSLAADEPVNEESLKYLNRLSDLLFVVARIINRDAGKAEPLWKHSR